MKPVSILIAGAALAPTFQPLLANEITWSGGAGGSWDWSVAANWGGAAPETNNNSILHFAGDGTPTGGNTWNNLGWWNTFHGIVFDSGAATFILHGDTPILAPNGNDDQALPSTIRNAGASPHYVAFSSLVLRGTTVDAAEGNITFSSDIATTWIDPSPLGGAVKVTGGAGKSVSFNGVIADGTGNSGAIIQEGPTVLKLAGNNTFSGGVLAADGVVEVQNNNSLGTGTVEVRSGAWLSLQEGTKVSNLVALAGGTIGWHFKTGAGSYNGEVVLDSDSKVGLANYYGFGSSSGTIQGVISGGGSLTVDTLDRGGIANSGGLLFLTADNTYTGATSIQGAKVFVNGSTHADSSVTVTGGGQLGGNGVVHGTAEVTSGSHISPGATDFTLATLSFGNGLTLDSGSDFYLDINTDNSASDKLAVTGNLTLTGSNLGVTNLGTADPASGAVFTLATYTGTLTGTFASLPEGSSVTIGGHNYTLKYADGGKKIKLTAPVTGSPYTTWAQTNITAIQPGADATPAGDPDKDGATNLAEFAFRGNPLAGGNTGSSTLFVADSSDAGTDKELILTVAIRKGNVAPFSGTPLAHQVDGLSYAIHGSLILSGAGAAVSEVTPVTSGLPDLSGDPAYEYRSFSLDASNGLAGKGFLRAVVTN